MSHSEQVSLPALVRVIFFVEGLYRQTIGLSQSRSLVLYRDVSQQFYVGPDRFVVHDVFFSVFLVDLLLQLQY